MATITWTGTASSDWATGANWSGGAEPANDDTVIIDGTVNIDGIDKSSVHIDYLFIRPTYTGRFGTSAASPVKVAVDNAAVIQGGSPIDGVFLNSGASNPIVSLTVAMPTPQHKCDIGGTVTNAWFQRGTISSSAAITNLTHEPTGNNPLNLPDTKINGGSATVFDCHNSNAAVMVAANIATLNLVNGTLWNHAGTYTTVNIIGNAEFKHYHTATITTVNCKTGGYFNAGLDARAKTVTNIILYSESAVNLDNGANSITATNGVKTPARLTALSYGIPPGSSGGTGSTP